MTHVTLVVGLPGSGKTTWARAQVARAAQAGLNAQLLDDPRDAVSLVAAVEQARAQRVDHLFIVDPHLCGASALAAAKAWFERHDLAMEVVHFANDPEQCVRNAASSDRQGKAVANAIRMWSRQYMPPASPPPLPVYRP